MRLRGGYGLESSEEDGAEDEEDDDEEESFPIMRTEGMTREDLIELGGGRRPARPIGEEEGEEEEEKGAGGDDGGEKRKVSEEVREAMSTFARLPLCIESREAFLMQVSIPQLFTLLTMPEHLVDGGQGEGTDEESIQAIGLRCLTKLLAGPMGTQQRAGLVAKLGSSLESVGEALRNSLGSSDYETLAEAVRILGLFSDENGGDFVARHQLALPLVRLVGGGRDLSVVSEATKALCSVVRSDSGLSAVFGGACLGVMEERLGGGAPRRSRCSRRFFGLAWCAKHARSALRQWVCGARWRGACGARTRSRR